MEVQVWGSREEDRGLPVVGACHPMQMKPDVYSVKSTPGQSVLKNIPETQTKHSSRMGLRERQTFQESFLDEVAFELDLQRGV